MFKAKIKIQSWRFSQWLLKFISKLFFNWKNALKKNIFHLTKTIKII